MAIRELIKGRRWVASIEIYGHVVYLGMFADRRKAERAYIMAEANMHKYEHPKVKTFWYDVGIRDQSYRMYDVCGYGYERESGMYHCRIMYRNDMITIGRYHMIEQSGLMYDLIVKLKQEREFCTDWNLMKAEAEARLVQIGKVLLKHGFNLGVAERVIEEIPDKYEVRNKRFKEGVFRFDTMRFSVGLWINGVWVHVGVFLKNRIACEMYEKALSVKDEFTGDVHAFRRLVGSYARWTQVKPQRVSGYEYNRKKDVYVAKIRRVNKYHVIGEADSPEEAALLFDAYDKGILDDAKRAEILAKVGKVN